MTFKIDIEHRRMANARERKRMKSLNVGFEHLRQRLPLFFHDKRLSKVETLKSAIEYISTLQNVLDQSNSSNIEDDYCNSSPSSNTTSPNYPQVLQTQVWTPPFVNCNYSVNNTLKHTK